MIVKVETTREQSLVMQGKTTAAVITDKKGRARPGQEIKFWYGDPRTKKGSLNFGTSKVASITDFEITHTVQGLQKQGTLHIGGFALGYDDATRVAVQAGFVTLQEMFRHFDFEHKGRLITWKSVQAFDTVSK